MEKTETSWTAVYAAAKRAVESERKSADRICYDPLARKFIGEFTFWLIKSVWTLRQLRFLGVWQGVDAQAYFVCRCRLVDDFLGECLAASFSQVVVLGAGLDSRAYREDRIPARIKVFEVDHPATQARKISRAQKILQTIPPHLSYIPLDFMTDSLDILRTHGLDLRERTLFIWEGVSYYLDPKIVEATLEWVARSSAPGSAIVFDYQKPHGSAGIRRHIDYRWTRVTRRPVERRDCMMSSAEIAEILSRNGFEGVKHYSHEDLTRLYCTGSNSQRKVLRNLAMVCAFVGAREL